MSCQLVSIYTTLAWMLDVWRDVQSVECNIVVPESNGANAPLQQDSVDGAKNVQYGSGGMSRLEV